MKEQIIKLVRNGAKFISLNSPKILMGAAIAGVVTTVIFAIQDTQKAIPELEREKEAKGEDLTFKEKLKYGGKHYVKTYLGIAGTTACIVGAHTVQERRMAALAAMYTLSESTLKDYKDKIIDLDGAKKEEKIHDEIMKDKVKDADPEGLNIIPTGKGTTLCYEPITGRYFWSRMEAIRKAENDIKGMIYCELRASLNDFFDFLDLPRTKLGDEIGWNGERPIDLRFTSSLTSQGTPILVVDHNEDPVPWYMQM